MRGNASATQGSFGSEVPRPCTGHCTVAETVGGTEPQGIVRSALPAAGAAMVAVPSARVRGASTEAMSGAVPVSPERSAVGCGTAESHRFGDDVADALRRGHQVIVGKVSIAGGGGVAAVSEELVHQGQVLAGHDGVAGHDVAEVVRSRLPMSASAMLRQCSVSTSPRRQPVSASGRMAAVKGTAELLDLVCVEEGRPGSWGSCGCRDKGLEPCERQPHSSARNIMARGSRAPGWPRRCFPCRRHRTKAATSSRRLRSGGMRPKAGRPPRGGRCAALAPRWLPVGIVAVQVLPGEVADGRGGPSPADVVGGFLARADALQGRAGAAVRLGQRQGAVVGDEDAVAFLDARVHDPDLAPGGVDAKPESGQALSLADR